jgi:hypothetical protein
MIAFLIVFVVALAIISIVRIIMTKDKKKDVGVISLINNIEKISKKRKR